jgi:hypothetical protein
MFGALDAEAVGLVETFPTRFPSISSFFFKSYRPGPGVEERLGLKVPTLAALTAKQLLARHPNPTWLVDQLLKAAVVMDMKDWTDVSAVGFTTTLQQLHAECHRRGDALALCSACKESENSHFHIPMMDFRLTARGNYGQV